jgi:DNA-binding response OmpR family regulator
MGSFPENHYIIIDDILITHSSATHHAKILMVDDDDQIGPVLKEGLEDITNYKIFLAFNAEEAFNILAEEHIDLIISNINMPGISGIELCEIVKESCEIPFIIFSGYRSPETECAVREAGADDYIDKPATIHYLKNKIDNLLDGLHR